MKRILLLIFLVLSATFAPNSLLADKSKNAEETIQKLEQEWGDALVKRDQAVIDRIASEDWVLTDPEGNLVPKAKADADVKSGTTTFESFHLDDLKVKVFGKTAIAYGLETEKSKYQGKDTSGQYRFTDVFIKRDGRWQAISTHVSRVASK